MVPLTEKCLLLSEAVFMSFEPVSCFCVMVTMLLYIYDIFLLGNFHIYMVCHLYDKNLLLFLFLCMFLLTILYLGSECLFRFSS